MLSIYHLSCIYVSIYVCMYLSLYAPIGYNVSEVEQFIKLSFSVYENEFLKPLHLNKNQTLLFYEVNL